MYYIYHIKGEKIGCTINLKKRTKSQGFNNYEILEEHTDIYIASEREIELQKQWGYKVDTKPYWKTIKMPTKESRIKGGNSCFINGKGFNNFKSRSKGGKMGGKITGNKNIHSGQLDKLHKLKQIPVIQMDKLGNIIQEFESGKIASDTLGIWTSTISKCCKGFSKTAGGFKFKFKNN
jgi:hypothetical protein